MATVVRRPSGKWQATVRKDGRSLSKSFTKRVDATSWSRETELDAERGALTQPKQQPSAVTVADVLRSYADARMRLLSSYSNNSMSFNSKLPSNKPCSGP